MRRFRKKYKRPKVPYNANQIAEERALVKKYGLKRKKEIWIARDLIRRYRQRARELIAVKNPEQETILLEKLVSIGMLKKGDGLDNALSLTVENLLDRRLQTVMHAKGMSKTPNQARQAIVHGHVSIGGRRASFPSYIVSVHEEAEIMSTFKPPEAKEIARGVVAEPGEEPAEESGEKE